MMMIDNNDREGERERDGRCKKENKERKEINNTTLIYNFRKIIPEKKIV